jgi:hypothetical protein
MMKTILEHLPCALNLNRTVLPKGLERISEAIREVSTKCTKIFDAEICIEFPRNNIDWRGITRVKQV